MLVLWRTLRRLLADLPDGASRFFLLFASLQGTLAILDVLALGLLAVTLAPLLASGQEPASLPVLGTVSDSALIWLLVAVGVLIVTKSVLAIALQWWATRRFARYEQALGARLLQTTFRAPWSERLTRNSTELVRATDVGVGATVAGVLIPSAQLTGEVFTFVAVLAVLLIAQPLLALAIIVYFVIIASLLYLWVLKRAVKAGQDNRTYANRAVRLISEMVHSLKEITLRGKAQEVAEVVLESRVKASQARANQSFLGAVPRYVLEAGLVGGLGIGAAVGYADDGLTGALTALALFGVAGFRIIPSLTRFQTIMAQTGANIPFAEQVLDEIARGQRYVDADRDRTREPVPTDATALTLDGVRFTYPGGSEPALRGIDLTLPFGSTLALVGASGSGKSTLVDVLLGLLEPQEGRITVGDVELGRVLDDWRGRVGYVPQDVSLFDASVARNVALTWRDEEVDDDRVRRALERAQLLDVIEARPGGIHGSVGERGMSLSGGQRQRLGVARALYSDPLVLVMDEATSALDTSTEAAVTQAVRDLAGEISVVVVAHRLATIRHSDQVCFLSDGRIEARGTFEQVIAQAPDFAVQAALAGLAEAGPADERTDTTTTTTKDGAPE